MSSKLPILFLHETHIYMYTYSAQQSSNLSNLLNKKINLE